MPLDIFTTGAAFATWPPKPGAPQQTSLNLTRPRFLRLNFELRLDETGTDRVVHSSVLKAALLDTDAPQSWVHLCLYGEWRGHPSGPFEFSLPVFNQICSNFDAQKNPVPWTIGHPWDTTPSEAWVRQLQIRGDGTGEHDGLYALVEWTADAASLIRAGKWKFCSVVIDLDATDRKTKQKIGCELIEVGLTNTPFIDGQLPITCSRHGAMETHMTPTDIVIAFARHLALAPLKFSTVKADAEKEITKAIAAAASALSLPKGTTVEKIIAKLTAMGAFLKTLTDGGDAGGDGATADDAAAMMASPNAAKLAKRIASLAALFAKLKFDAADQAMIQGGDGVADPDPDQALDGVEAKLMAATNLDAKGLAAAIETNLDAIASLLTNGGAPAAAPGGAAPAAMSREVAELRTQLKALEARDRENSAKLATLTQEREAAIAAESARALEALKSEAQTLIDAAQKDGRLVLNAGKEEGSEVESAREYFALDHGKAKKWLASKPRVVPVAPITEGAGAKPVPVPGAPAAPGTAPMGLDVKTYDFKPKDEAEKQICRTFSARDEATRRRLMVALNAHRSRRSAPQPAA